MKYIFAGLLLYSLTLQSKPTISNNPSSIEIEAFLSFNDIMTNRNGETEIKSSFSKTRLSLKRNIYGALQQIHTHRSIRVADSVAYKTSLRLKTITQEGVAIECVTTKQNAPDQTNTQEITFPFHTNINDIWSLELIDVAGKHVTLTVSSLITQ